MKTIALISKPGQPAAVELAKEVKERHPNLELLVEPHLAEPLGWKAATDPDINARAELVVVLGGDGTLIHAARTIKGRAVPILGVNLGSLGFMTEIVRGDFSAAFDEAIAGKAKVDSRMKLTCRLFRGEQQVLEDEVLNDVVINKSGVAKIADFETWLEHRFVALFKADGIIFSTPTGSTAYNISAGGPIVHPAIDCVAITPICPHSLTQRPIIVPGDQVLRVVLKSEVSDVYLTIDGQVGHPLQTGDRIEIQKSPNRAHLIRSARLDWFGILRTKLRWGER